MGVRIKRRVWIGTLVACAGVGGWLAWTRREPVPPEPERRAPPPFVRLAGAGIEDRVLREKTELLDPTPLFFPTEWNYGQRATRARSLRQPDQVFASYPPKLTVAEQAAGPFGADEAEVPEKLSDVLAQGNEAPFAGMGERDVDKSTLPVRAGFIDVRRLGSRESVLSQSLTGINPPAVDYAPIEFLVVVGTAGLVGEPLLTGGSGLDEVDNFFRDYLVKAYRLGGRLPPGRYRVLVGA